MLLLQKHSQNKTCASLHDAKKLVQAFSIINYYELLLVS